MLCHVCNRAAIQAQWFDAIPIHFKLLLVHFLNKKAQENIFHLTLFYNLVKWF